MEQWIDARNICVDELMRHDANLSSSATCPECEEDIIDTDTFRCLDCLPIPPECEACTLKRHVLEPFHRIEVRAKITLNENDANYRQ